MSAKEMFEELGYKFVQGIDCIYYEQIKNHDYYVIIFNDDKTITKKRFYSYEYEYITFDELKAINKQIEELDWNE